MSKYDIGTFCPPQKNHRFAAQTCYWASPAAACEYHMLPTHLRCNLHLILVFVAPSIPVSSPGPRFPLSPLLGWIRPLLKPQSCSHSSTFHSSFLFTSVVANLPACTSALSPFCQSIPASYSIKCFCIPSPAAALFDSPMSIFFWSQLSLYPLLLFSLRCLTKSGSKFLICQDALKFVAQEVQN